MAWFSVTIDVALEHADALQGALHEAQASGLEVKEHDTLPMPGAVVPGEGRALVVAYFESRPLADEAVRQVDANFDDVTCTVEPVVERDWSVEWRSRVRSVTVGRLWVGPPWEKPPAGKVAIFVEPKMAFGTGDHPTTSLGLAAVDAFMKDNAGATVLDVGMGTGVLAFAAKKLGASTVAGIDNDPVAVQLAQECATENNLTGLTLSSQTLDAFTAPFDLVLANILANTLIELAPALARLTKKRLVLAGVLVHQADEVRQAFVGRGLKHLHDEIDGEWIRLDFGAP
jgi:ribosomal protein L11 methyltransferase